jgi:hypothetical protein
MAPIDRPATAHGILSLLGQLALLVLAATVAATDVCWRHVRRAAGV